MEALIIGTDHGVFENWLLETIRQLDDDSDVQWWYEGYTDLNNIDYDISIPILNRRHNILSARGLENQELMVLVCALFAYVSIKDPRLLSILKSSRGIVCDDDKQAQYRMVKSLAHLFHFHLDIVSYFACNTQINQGLSWWHNFGAGADWTFRLKRLQWPTNHNQVPANIIQDGYNIAVQLLQFLSPSTEFTNLIDQVDHNRDLDLSREAAMSLINIVQQLRDEHTITLLTKYCFTHNIIIVGGGHVDNLNNLLTKIGWTVSTIKNYKYQDLEKHKQHLEQHKQNVLDKIQIFIHSAN